MTWHVSGVNVFTPLFAVFLASYASTSPQIYHWYSPCKAGGAVISDEGFSLTACKQGLSVLLKWAGVAAPILDIHDPTR